MKMKMKMEICKSLLILPLVMSMSTAYADCEGLPNHAALQDALINSVAPNAANGGFELNMWGTIVDRDGIVCAVAMTGDDRGDQWPGSRVISAQKANTANAFSLPGLALSTANLFAAVQPGGSLFGLQFSNPVNPAVAYDGANAANYGTANDPLVGEVVGGVNVFGGGLALYGVGGILLGAIGVSGDSSCADHNVAWRTRDGLSLDYVPGGVGSPGDNIIFDYAPTNPGKSGFESMVSASGFGHPTCGEGNVQVNEGVVAEHPLLN
jgi:uncharacterized protein GlcG (DUF336 family)